MEYYIAIKNIGDLFQLQGLERKKNGDKWMELEKVVLSELTQKEETNVSTKT